MYFPTPLLKEFMKKKRGFTNECIMILLACLRQSLQKNTDCLPTILMIFMSRTRHASCVYYPEPVFALTRRDFCMWLK